MKLRFLWGPNSSQTFQDSFQLSWCHGDRASISPVVPTEPLIKKSYNTGSFMVWWTQLEKLDNWCNCNLPKHGRDAIKLPVLCEWPTAFRQASHEGSTWRGGPALGLWFGCNGCLTPPFAFRFFLSTNRIAVWFASTPRARDWKCFPKKSEPQMQKITVLTIWCSMFFFVMKIGWKETKFCSMFFYKSIFIPSARKANALKTLPCPWIPFNKILLGFNSRFEGTN